MEAEKARTLVWQLMHEAVWENPSRPTTLADLSATVTRSAARILGMDEEDLVRLLRSYRPH